MYCQQCGAQIDNGLVFCTSCGAKQTNTNEATRVAPKNEVFQQNSQNSGRGQNTWNNQQNFANYSNVQSNTTGFVPNGNFVQPEKVSFGEAIKRFFKNYANFDGRATKAEFWWATLFEVILSVCALFIPYLNVLVFFGTAIPSLSVGVRRLHDTGKSGAYILMSLIPLAGPFIVIVQYCKDSVPDNQWGPVSRQ